MKKVEMSYLSGETVEVELIENEKERAKFLTEKNLGLDKNFVVVIRKWNWSKGYQYAGIALGDENIIRRDNLSEDRIAVIRLDSDEHFTKAMKRI